MAARRVSKSLSTVNRLDPQAVDLALAGRSTAIVS
jgi:hypothetical protein